MAYQNIGETALNYEPCRYGTSKLLFRGPKKALDVPYIACIGGTETYGKFVEKPFATLLEERLEIPTVNLGCVNAGADVFAADDVVMDLCSNAALTVLQISGAQNVSNCFYSVHPRRNDRFLRASGRLENLYPNIDFSGMNFTRHLVATLQESSPEAFAQVKQGLKDAWVTQMQNIVERLSGNVILLWVADRDADEDCNGIDKFGRDPLFVDRTMIEQLRPMVKDIVEVVGSANEITQGYERMVFSDFDMLPAREMLGPIVQAKVADALAETIDPLSSDR